MKYEECIFIYYINSLSSNKNDVNFNVCTVYNRLSLAVDLMQTCRKYRRHTSSSMGTNSKLGPQILAAFAGMCFKRKIKQKAKAIS